MKVRHLKPATIVIEVFFDMKRLNNFGFSFHSIFLGGSAMRNVFATAVVLGIALLATAAGADGETITGVLSSGSSSPSSPIDISTATNDWAYFGKRSGVTSGSTVLFAADTKSGGASSFSSITAVGRTNDWWTTGIGDDSQHYLSFSGGAPNASTTADRHFVYAEKSISFTHTLFADSEILNIYLTDSASNPINNVDLTATLGAATYSATKVTLPYAYSSSNTYGVLSLKVSGTVGEVLTFTMVNNLQDNGSIGVQAVTATVSTPEPNTAMLLGAGLIGLAAYAWRKRR